MEDMLRTELACIAVEVPTGSNVVEDIGGDGAMTLDDAGIKVGTAEELELLRTTQVNEYTEKERKKSVMR